LDLKDLMFLCYEINKKCFLVNNVMHCRNRKKCIVRVVFLLAYYLSIS